MATKVGYVGEMIVSVVFTCTCKNQPIHLFFFFSFLFCSRFKYVFLYRYKRTKLIRLTWTHAHIVVRNYNLYTKSSLLPVMNCATSFYITLGNYLSRSSAVTFGFVMRLCVTKIKAPNKEMALMMCGLMACSGTAVKMICSSKFLKNMLNFHW